MPTQETIASLAKEGDICGDACGLELQQLIPCCPPPLRTQGEGTSGDVSRLHSTAMPISGRPFLRDDEPGDPEPSAAASDLYARSITVVPQSMVLPGPMR